jgi:hypothetical protein
MCRKTLWQKQSEERPDGIARPEGVAVRYTENERVSLVGVEGHRRNAPAHAFLELSSQAVKLERVQEETNHTRQHWPDWQSNGAFHASHTSGRLEGAHLARHLQHHTCLRSGF